MNRHLHAALALVGVGAPPGPPRGGRLARLVLRPAPRLRLGGRLRLGLFWPAQGCLTVCLRVYEGLLNSTSCASACAAAFAWACAP